MPGGGPRVDAPVTTGQIVLLAAVALALGFGAWRGLRDGRFRGTHEVRGAEPASGPAEPGVLDGTDVEHTLGERATLLQFSSAFCAPCRATRRVLGEVAAAGPRRRPRGDRRRAPPRAGPPGRRAADPDHADPRRRRPRGQPGRRDAEARRRCWPRWRASWSPSERKNRHLGAQEPTPRRGVAVRMMERMSISWDFSSGAVGMPRRLAGMSTTMLTRRRAVDHCRVRSALCRMP